MPYKAGDPAVRFWRLVERTDEAACWEWKGAIKPNGYGNMEMPRRERRTIAVHRFSWELHFGPVPEGQCVLHRCDNRRCVNPGHLFLGTKSDNTVDMVNKGRHPRQKLTVEQMDAIAKRARAGESSRTLAAEYGISVGLVQYHKRAR